jgi:hypothetical protein
VQQKTLILSPIFQRDQSEDSQEIPEKQRFNDAHQIQILEPSDIVLQNQNISEDVSIIANQHCIDLKSSLSENKFADEQNQRQNLHTQNSSNVLNMKGIELVYLLTIKQTAILIY